jgi:hypothetical protein
MSENGNRAEPAPDSAETVSEARQAVEQFGDEVESIQDRLIDTVTASQQEAIETLESASQAIFEMIARARVEVTDFVAERIRQDLDTQQAFLRCRTLDDVRDVQMNFLRTALDQYGDEAAKLVRLGGEVAAKSLERARA